MAKGKVLFTVGGEGVEKIASKGRALFKSSSDDIAERFAIAQRNAALPIEQGGLGLRPNNTPMERARAMGYKTPAYHATTADIKEFDPQLGSSWSHASAGGRSWFISDPKLSHDFIGGGFRTVDPYPTKIYGRQGGGRENITLRIPKEVTQDNAGAAIYPVLINEKNAEVMRAGDAQRLMFEGNIDF